MPHAPRVSEPGRFSREAGVVRLTVLIRKLQEIEREFALTKEDPDVLLMRAQELRFPPGDPRVSVTEVERKGHQVLVR